MDFLCLKVNKHTNIDFRYLVNTYLLVPQKCSVESSINQAQILTPIPSTGFMYNPHMGKDSNLTCFEVFCLFSIGAFTSNTALRN